MDRSCGSIASAIGRRWLSSGAVSSIFWPGLLNGKAHERIFMLTVLPVARAPWSIWKVSSQVYQDHW